MPNEFDHLSDDEQLKAENEFLKMKMMLENGAQFGSMHQGELSAEFENQFLKNIVAFEEQFASSKTTSVFEKIGQPSHFLPSNQIADENITAAWQQLDAYLNTHQISLTACSPRVSDRELYRFTTEELFSYQMSDINVEGYFTNFIYDEFYPDHVFENTKTALEDCIKDILDTRPLEYMHFYTDAVTLNGNANLSQNEVKMLVNRFKAAYSDIVIKELEVADTTINTTHCTVKGNYEATVYFDNQEQTLSGNWQVNFEQDIKFDYWHIYEITISGIRF
jgi:hypothetical protein